ncbi:3D domain-containing protein [Lactobacillus sp. CC-MHH1034]|uniref:hypothetical protein n=1 Tax=Agrilactobacillus fermenti TaxID=2586909 RepID=UPI0038B236C0|nr:3D domain-containing protein [Agrilactobacillus fermenti]
MKIKNLLLSVVALGTLTTTSVVSVATSVSADANTSISAVYYASATTQVFSAPNGTQTAQTLPTGSAWKVTNKTVVNGQTWLQVGGTEWVTDQTMPENPVPTATDGVMYVTGQWGAAVYNSPYSNHQNTGRVLEKNSGWKVTQKVDVDGATWYQVGGDAWIWGGDLSDQQPVVQAPGRVMNATAYDPRVLGNYTFGYDTVAANLSVFPRGTKLRITFANGTTKDYVVRDTGGFAYANPNQIDIAMPNGQAMQFGRQNVTVSVLN